MRLPAPQISSFHESCYKSFHQEHISPPHKYGNFGQTSVVKKDLGRCEICPNYSFSPKTQKERDKSLFHRRQSTTIKTAPFICNVSGAVFTSASVLNKHKKIMDIQHKICVQKPPKENQEPKKPQLQYRKKSKPNKEPCKTKGN